MKRLTFDFETRSKSNLKKEGAFKYSLDPSTQPTCLAFKIHDEPKVYFLDFTAINRKWEDQPLTLILLWNRFIKDDWEFSAHNAFFERCIYENILVKRYGWPLIPARQYRCTAAKAAACALPRNLEGAGEAMKLTVQKDKRGYAAMMATCKPQKRYGDWNKMMSAIEDRHNKDFKLTPKQQKWIDSLKNRTRPEVFITPESHPDIFQTLYTYCKIDVRSEEQLDLSLPDLIPQEQEIWHFNQLLNWRGLRIDIPTVKKIIDMMALESKKKLKELDILTMGLITKPGATKSIIEFLAMEGIELPNLRSKTVSDKLGDFDIDENVRRLLEIRKALSLTSTKKYQGMLDRAMPDHRVRDILLYHGASTGRDTGTGIQPHNFPRGLLKVNKDKPYAHVENVIECNKDMLELLYGEDSLAMLFSAILRNMIIPTEGSELFVADFSKIEVAVLWWLADNRPGLAILNSGKDPYKYMAAQNTGKRYEEISDDGDERQLGKAQVLGCGFQMGPDRFRQAAWDMYRLKLTEEQSRIAVANYRTTNAAVPILWKAYEAAAIGAVENPGQIFKAGKCNFFTKSKFLWIELPSGRKLAYREPDLSWRETEWGPRKTLEFWAVNSLIKKWAKESTFGGKICENIVQATARDLMMPAMARLETAGYKGLLMVHDEGICEKPKGTGNLKEFVNILCARPNWADKNLPIEAKGWIGPRYRK